MLCLLNAETYKLRKSKSFYICMIVIAVFAFLMYGMMLIVDNIRQGNVENGTAGIIVTQDHKVVEEAPGSIWDEIGVMDLLQEIYSSDTIACLLAIFVSIFVIHEFGSGMMKNIVGKGCPRSSIYLSKLLVSMLAAAIIALTGMAATLLAGRVLIGAKAFAGDFWKNLPIYATLQLLLILSLVSVFVCVSEISRNLAASIAAGIGISALPALLLNAADMLFTDSSRLPSQFWLVTRMSGCPFDGFTAGYATETLLVAIFWLILTTGLGIWHFYRTDIK